MTKLKWTKDLISKEAKKYETRKEFKVGSGGAYNAAKKVGILDEVCSHMEGMFIWTKDLIVKEGKKYKTRKKFRLGSGGAYAAAKKIGIFEEVCSHMGVKIIWTKDLIVKEAEKYKTRKKFRLGSRGACEAARKAGILDEVCSHMKDGASGFQKKKKGSFYVIRQEVSGRNVDKFGITNRGKHRYSNVLMEEKGSKLIATFNGTGTDVWNMEAEIKSSFKVEREGAKDFIGTEGVLGTGNTELLFASDVSLNTYKRLAKKHNLTFQDER